MRPLFGGRSPTKTGKPPNPLQTILDGVRQRSNTLTSQVRLWWETQWSQPSRGNSLWEDVPFTDHLRSLLERRLNEGVVPLIHEGNLYLYEDEAGHIMQEKRDDGMTYLTYFDENTDDWVMREFGEGSDFQNPLELLNA